MLQTESMGPNALCLSKKNGKKSYFFIIIESLGGGQFHPWPDIDDLRGAALALAQLWNQYK